MRGVHARLGLAASSAEAGSATRVRGAYPNSYESHNVLATSCFRFARLQPASVLALYMALV